MPPKSFAKVVVAVSGTFPGYKQSDLKLLVEERGATFSSTVVDECTHLVTTQKDVDKKTAKCQQALNCSKCCIVSLDWLLDSDQARKPLPEEFYHLNPSQAGPQTEGRNGTLDSAKKSESKKRGADQEVDSDNHSSKKQKDAQKASFKTVKVPVDPGFLCFPIDPARNYQNPFVHIDDTGLIWDATLNQTNASFNNNKFYRLQLIVMLPKDTSKPTEYVTWGRWGRVGEQGSPGLLCSGTFENAKDYFEKKFKDKSGLKWASRLDPPKKGKYTFIERDFEEDDGTEGAAPVAKNGKPKVESTLPESIQNLMSFIFNQHYFLSAMASMSYDAKKMPLGKLSDKTLKTGFSILKELSDLIIGQNVASARAELENLSNRYFTTIPHVFGRYRPPILATQAQIKKEVELLEALTDMDVANEIMKGAQDDNEVHELDSLFHSLGMVEMTQLDSNSTEYKELEDYLLCSRGTTHFLQYKVIDVFRIERKGENDRFTSSPFANLKNSDRRLLWHGSRSTNFGGILSQGLRIAPPEAPVNGYMFGKGVYLADTSSKSALYCCSSNSANMGLLLLCDVELGDPMFERNQSDYMAGENARKEGKIATLGVGGTVPGAWKDAACLHPSLQGVKMPDVSADVERKQNACLQYNEYIAYDVSQIRQRYLFYVQMK